MPKAVDEKKKGKTGRPKKFGRPTRAFYLALPEDIVERLRSVDPDIATAIVRIVEGITFAHMVEGVEVTPLGGGRVLLWVGEAKTLRSWPGVLLHQVEPGRHLLILDREYEVSKFELDLRDFLEGSPPIEDRAILERLALVLRELRCQKYALVTPAVG